MDGRTVTTTGVSFYMSAPQPVRVPAAVPSVTTPFSIATRISQEQAKEKMNFLVELVHDYGLDKKQC